MAELDDAGEDEKIQVGTDLCVKKRVNESCVD